MTTKSLNGKKIVIKLSGKAIDDSQILHKLLHEVCDIRKKGAIVWIIHGGGKQIDKELEKNGVTPKFLNGLRVTDTKTLEIVKTILDAVRKKIANSLITLDNEIDVCEISDYIILSKIKPGEYGLVGEPIAIDETTAVQYLNSGISIVSSIGRDIASGGLLNINADDAAVEVAKFLKADKLIVVSDVPGVLTDKNDKNSVIKKMNGELAEQMIADGKIGTGMIPKIRSCVEAAKSIGTVCIINAEIGITKGLEEQGGTTIIS